MVFVQDIRKAQAFVTVVFEKDNVPNFNNVMKQHRLAELLGKPRYLLVREGEDQGVFMDMSWNKIIRFSNEKDIPKIMQYIDREVMGGGFYT